MFGGQVNVREGRSGRGQGALPEPEGRSVNTDTDWKKIPSVGGVLTAIVTRILGLRGSSGHRNGSCFQRMDVKSAFRQVTVAPDRAGACAYRWRISIRRPPIAVSGGKGARIGVGGSERNSGAHRTTT